MLKTLLEGVACETEHGCNYNSKTFSLIEKQVKKRPGSFRYCTKVKHLFYL